MSARLFAVCFMSLLAVVVTCTACSDSIPSTSPVIELPPVAGNGDFPAPHVLKGVSSTTPAGGYLVGDDYDTVLPSPGADSYNGNLRLRAWASNDLAYAFFNFELDGIANEILELGWMARSGDFVLEKEEVRGDVFVGLADLSSGVWDWFDILDPVPGIGSLNDYVSEGNLLLAIVSTSYADISVNYLRAAETDWAVQEVPFGNAWPEMVVADLNSNDLVQISNGREYAKLTPTGWLVEDLVNASGAGMGVATQLIIDTEDTAHICTYQSYDWAIGGYHYYANSGTGWVQEWGVGTMENNPMSRPPYSGKRYWVCMAFDTGNQPHFAYFMEREFDLHYAGPNGDGTWSSELVDADGKTGERCWITLDSTDIPHIAYHANDHYAGRHAWLDEGVWQVEELFEATSYGVDLSTATGDEMLAGFIADPPAFDDPASLQLYTLGSGMPAEDFGYSAGGSCYLEQKADGNQDLLYRRYSNQALRIESWNGSEWNHSWVDVPDDSVPTLPTYDLCFMLDSQNRPHIVYATGDYQDAQVYYAHR